MRGKQWNRWIICLLSAMLLAVSCTISFQPPGSHHHPVPEKAGFPSPPVPTGREANKSGQIIFITMTIARDPQAGSRIIQVQEVLRSAGSLKAKARAASPTGPYLGCILFSGQDRLDSIFLDHPLYRQVEYVNDQHQLARKAVSTDQAEFFIRFQQGQADGLRIEERLPDSLPKELITIKF